MQSLDFTTNQPGVQIFSGNWLQIPRKVVHGGPSLIYDQYSAIAIEPEGYLDAINDPEWNVDQICKSLNRTMLTCILTHAYLDHPGRDFKWATTYRFSVVK